MYGDPGTLDVPDYDTIQLSAITIISYLLEVYLMKVIHYYTKHV